MLELSNSCVKILNILKHEEWGCNYWELRTNSKLGISETMEATQHLVELKYVSSYEVATEGEFPDKFFLTQHGKSYMVYRTKQSKLSRRYWITTGIAILALAISLIALAQ